MLRCKLEIIPFGDETKTYEIGRLDIFNKGSVEFGHCKYGVIELNQNETPGMYSEDILHRRNLGAWALVNKVLNNKENKMEPTNEQMQEAHQQIMKDRLKEALHSKKDEIVQTKEEVSPSDEETFHPSDETANVVLN